MTWTITADVRLKFAILSFCLLTADVDQHRAPSSLTLGRIRERRGALLFVRRKESAANSFAADRKRNSSLLSFCSTFVSSFCLLPVLVVSSF